MKQSEDAAAWPRDFSGACDLRFQIEGAARLEGAARASGIPIARLARWRTAIPAKSPVTLSPLRRGLALMRELGVRPIASRWRGRACCRAAAAAPTSRALRLRPADRWAA